jgi:2-hydroxy-3-keto-5-methylthiopentenyl-1-phosphate phosphatase
MVDTVGMGYTERRKINEKIIHEQVSYREGFRTMIESVHRPFNEMEALVRKGECKIYRLRREDLL